MLQKVYSSEVEQWTFNPKALGSIPSILKTVTFLAQLARAITF